MSTKNQYVVTLDDDDPILEHLRKKGALKRTDEVSAPFVPLQVEEDSARGHPARRGAQTREQIEANLSRLLKGHEAQEILPNVLKQLGLQIDGISKEEPSERSEAAALERLQAENEQRKALLAKLRAEQDRARKYEAEIQRLKRQNRTSRTSGPGEQQIEEQARDPVMAELLAKLKKQDAEIAELKRQRTAGPVDVPMGPAPPAAAPPAASTDDIAASSPASPGSNDKASASGQATPEPGPSDGDDEVSSIQARRRHHPTVSGLRLRSDPAAYEAAISPTGSSSTAFVNGDGASSAATSPPSDSRLSSNPSAESATVPSLRPTGPGPSTSAPPGDPSRQSPPVSRITTPMTTPPKSPSDSQQPDPGPEDVAMADSDPVPVVDLTNDSSEQHPIFEVPVLSGSIREQLDQLLAAYKMKFPIEEEVLKEFRPGNFLGKGWINTLVSNELPDGYRLDDRDLDLGLTGKTTQPLGLVILDHVNYSNQRLKGGQNHWVAAVVDLVKRTYIGWGMTEEKRKLDAKALAKRIGGKEFVGETHEFDSTGNVCGLRCVESVQLHFQKITKREPDPVALRLHYLKRWIEIMNKKATEALTSSNREEDKTPVIDPEVAKLWEIELEAIASRKQQVSTAEAAPGSPSEPLGHQAAGAEPDVPSYPPDQTENDGAATPDSRQRTKLPTKRRPAPPSNLGASQAPSAPSPQSSNSGNTTPPASGVLHGVSWTTMTPESEGHQKTIGGSVFLLNATLGQVQDLQDFQDLRKRDHVPLLLAVAEELGAREHGVFLINTPEESRPVLPEQRDVEGNCTTYKVQHLENGFVRLLTERNRRTIPSTNKLGPIAGNIKTATQWYQDLLSSTLNNKKLQYGEDKKKDVAYMTDIPAHTAEERAEALLPKHSLIYPIRGNQLPQQGVPGVNTTTAYNGTPGAPFGWHKEDFEFGALNNLHRGYKVWHATKPRSFETATTYFKEMVGERADHDQFMKHESLHQGIEHMRASGISIISFIQSPGQIVVLYPGAYHSGFSLTPTLAEAVNIADELWKAPVGYRPCLPRCDNDRLPITLDKIFPKGHKWQGADNERRSDDERHGDAGQRANTAGRRMSMRTRKDTGGVQRTADEQHLVSEQNAGRRRSTRTRSQASSDVTVSTLTKRPATGINAAQLQTKKLKQDPDLRALAKFLLDDAAAKRFRDLVTAWEEIDLNKRPSFDIGEEVVAKNVAAYFNRSSQLARAAGLNALLSLLMRMHAVTVIDKKTKDDGRTYADPILLHDIHKLLDEPVDYKTFKNRISNARSLKHLRAWIIFLPFQGVYGAAIRDYENLQSKQVEELCKHLNNPELYGRAHKFFQSILGSASWLN